MWIPEYGPFFGQDAGESVVDAIDLQALSVTVMAIVVGCAAVLFAGQTIARQSRREWDDTAILEALGMSRSQRCAAAALRAVPVAATAAVVAGATAITVAQAGPIGIARAADTSRGLQIDAGVLLVGLPVVVIVIVACTVAAGVEAREGRGERPAPGGAGTGGCSLATRAGRLGIHHRSSIWPAGACVGRRRHDCCDRGRSGRARGHEQL